MPAKAKRNLHVNIRSTNVLVSKIYVDPTVHYNGACEPYEDAADYITKDAIKAVRLA